MQQRVRSAPLDHNYNGSHALVGRATDVAPRVRLPEFFVVVETAVELLLFQVWDLPPPLWTSPLSCIPLAASLKRKELANPISSLNPKASPARKLLFFCSS